MDDFWDGCVISSKKVRSRTPPRCPWTHFLRTREVFFLFECSCFWIFVILEPCGLLPSTLIFPSRAGWHSCFCWLVLHTCGVSRRRSRLRRSVIFGRSDGAALRAAFGIGQRFALPWGASGGAGFRSFGSGFEVPWLGFEVLGLGFGVSA